MYNITPFGIVFPASITNDTTQIFILGKNLSGIKKAILSNKIFDILAVVDLKKINNWKDIKGQTVWTNAAIKDRKEISNNPHICFPFITKPFSDLCSFNIFLQDDSYKKLNLNRMKKTKYL